jgi:iron complex outermembrane receptor protein
MRALWLLTAATIGVAHRAPAQEAPTAPSARQAEPDEAEAKLEEIVVTARKREENLQDTPIAVSAFTGAVLQTRGISDISGIAASTPSLRFNAAAPVSGSSNSVSVFIRGVGQTDFNLTIDPGVGLYLDGIYISRSVGALLDTTDIERVEVLRGPQGTLFGKNTIGGAVSITSRRPGSEFAVNAEGTIGSRERRDMKVAVDLPISDTLRIRATGATINRDGYVRSFADNKLRGDKGQLTGRFVAEYSPSANTTFTLSVDGTRVREAALATVPLDIRETGGFAVFNNIFLNGASCAPPNPARFENSACYNSQWLTNDPYKTWSSDDGPSRSDTWGAALTASFGIGGGAEIKSIMSYRHLTSDFGLDTDQSPVLIANSSNNYSQKQFSQEIQLSGAALASRLKYLFGIYYLNEKGTDVNTLTTAPTTFRSGGSVNNDSYAAFGQLTYDFSSQFGITLGGRFTRELKRFTPDQVVLSVDPVAQIPIGTGANTYFLTNPVTSAAAGSPQPLRVGDLILPNVEVKTKVNRFTPAISLNYKPSRDVLLYASYSRGFKSGGFTQRIFPPEPVTPSFAPETVDAYEIGLKSEFLDRRVRFNAAAFYNDYKDLQIVVTEGFAPKVRNAGRARIWGIEAELEAVPTEWLRLNASASYLNARYRQVDPAAAPVTVNNRLVDTPEWLLSAGATIDLAKGDWGVISARGDWSYSSSVAKDAENTPLLIQRGYHVVNASLNYATEDRKWGAGLGVTNLTDTQYLVTGYRNSFVDITYGNFARPREWYLRLSVGF